LSINILMLSFTRTPNRSKIMAVTMKAV